jgi:hypothetical protein
MGGYGRSVYCRNCWKEGHNIRTCPTASEYLKASFKKGGLRARKCSWCSSQDGHNKASCPVRKTAIKEYIVKNASYRASVLALMHKTGFGIGALVTTNYADDADKNLYMVNNISWDRVQIKRKYDRIADVTSLTDQYDTSMTMPEETPTCNDSSTLVSSPAPAHVIGYDMPSNWLDGSSGIDKFF